MTFDVTIFERAAKLVVQNNAFIYTREDGASVARTFSIEPAGEGRYSVLIEGRSYQVVLVGNGEVVVNGRTLRVNVVDPRKLRSRDSAEKGGGRQTIATPMPGRVIRVLVEVGQEVEAGQGLIVVEAMKMQNEMKSPKPGKILEIRTSAGAAVAAGDALLVME
jgi:biotin carboxyl carrier protein